MTLEQRLAVKRGVDIVVAGALLILTSPMSLWAAACIVRESGRPILFTQRRSGMHKEPFTLFKLRTMSDGRDAFGQPLTDTARLTPLGKRLRALSIDELPQLWNVMRGDMSLVGPRPLLPEYDNYYTEVENTRFAMRPGITGLAQLAGRNTLPWDQRLAKDVEYVANWSLRLDVALLVRTAVSLFRNRADVVLDPRSVMQDLDVERRDRKHGG